MNSPLTEKQKGVAKVGKRGERTAKDWLIRKGFTNEEYSRKAHTGYYDIRARKGDEKWLIEVKTGENPSLNIPNFLKMVKEKGVNIGLALVSGKAVYLLQIRERTLAGKKAWSSRAA